jgi:hypothetical protein
MIIRKYITPILLIVLIFMIYNQDGGISSEAFREIQKREDVFRDSLRVQALEIDFLKSKKEEKEVSFRERNNLVNNYRAKPVKITKIDSTFCMPIIKDLFDCKDILFGFQKSSLELNLANDSLIYALKDNSGYKDKFLALKDEKFEAKPRKVGVYVTLSGSVALNTFDDLKVGGLITTRGKWAYGYQYGINNKSHEVKLGFRINK